MVYFGKNENLILVTGASGMVGMALHDLIPHAHFLIGHDLRDPFVAQKIFRSKIKYVIHLAAKVGGVQANMQQMADFYTDNILINTNVLRYAAESEKVEKVVSVLSTCIYPDKVTYPLTEDQIHNGPPHESNFAYAYAKRMLDVQSRALRKQHGKNFVTVVVNNIFGEHDNFHLENSHVIPAMIRKIYEAKYLNKKLILWGDGSSEREFTYSKDFAAALLFVLRDYNDEAPLNVGNTSVTTIKEVAKVICKHIGYDFNLIEWDTSKPTGQMKKPSCNKRFIKLGWNSALYTPFEEAIEKTISWFVKNYPNVRGFQ